MRQFLSILILVILLTACAPIVMPAAPTPTVEPVEITPIVELTETPILWATNTPTQTDAEKAANTPTPLPPTAMPILTPGKRPPACTFPLVGMTMAEATSKTYTFSEPQVVLTSQTPLGVAGWLPDGKHLLITRDLPNSARQSIEVLNVLSGETDKYAERDGNQKPLWLPALQAVVYDTNIMSEGNSPSLERKELWMSRGPASQPEKIASDIFSTSVSPDGNQVFFFSRSAGNALQTWRVDTQKEQSIPLNMQGPIYSEASLKLGVQKPTQVFWVSRSNNSWIAFYAGDLLFLADTQNGDVCEVDLGTGKNGPNLANNVQWSADGRYLAMTISSGYPGINVEPYRHILVLDVVTGEQYQPDLKVPYVDELAWAPNTHTLAVLGMVEVEEPGQMGLFLLEIDRKYVERVLPDWSFWTSLRGALSWRPDGQALTLHCSTRTPVPILEFRICVTQVSAQQ